MAGVGLGRGQVEGALGFRAEPWAGPLGTWRGGALRAGHTGPGSRTCPANHRLGEPPKWMGGQAGLGDRAKSSVHRRETEAHRGGPPRTLSLQLGSCQDAQRQIQRQDPWATGSGSGRRGPGRGNGGGQQKEQSPGPACPHASPAGPWATASPGGYNGFSTSFRVLQNVTSRRATFQKQLGRRPLRGVRHPCTQQPSRLFPGCPRTQQRAGRLPRDGLAAARPAAWLPGSSPVRVEELYLTKDDKSPPSGMFQNHCALPQGSLMEGSTPEPPGPP